MTIQALPQRVVIPGFVARFVHTDTMTLAYWEVEKDAVLPLHAHLHEQVTQVEEGSFEMTVDGVTQTYGPGELVVIPAYVEHSGRALTDCRLFDIFSPVREDYR